MYSSQRVMNHLMSSVMMEYIAKKWPLYCQEGYHYFVEWLVKNNPEKLEVFMGKVTHDYNDHFSLERHKLWTACQWVCEWLDRADRQHIPVPHQKIDACIRKELGMRFLPHLVKYDEMYMHLVPDDFEFEAYLRKEAIGFFGLPVFIAAVELFVAAFKDWSPRYFKVSQALIYQDFIADGLLNGSEQRIYARLLINFCTRIHTYPRVFFETMNTTDMIRRHMAVHEAEQLKLVPDPD